MIASIVSLALDRDPPVYQPGETLSGWYGVDPDEGSPVKAVEISVLWYTMGKGEEDLAIHHFHRWESAPDDVILPHEQRTFRVPLPNSPLSYDGQIVKICWCVRARVFFSRGKDAFIEERFQLGEVPAACDAAS